MLIHISKRGPNDTVKINMILLIKILLKLSFVGPLSKATEIIFSIDWFVRCLQNYKNKFYQFDTAFIIELSQQQMI